MLQTYSYRVTDTVGNPVLRAGVIDLNLTIKNGEFVVLTGCSGCGKTTVCRLINGLIPHYFDGEKTGDIFLDGKDVSKQPIYETARTVGSVLEEGEIIFAVKKASGSSRYEKIVTMMPITVLSAIREARDHDIAVKGGKFLEAVAEADTIVFDKTGTLTKAKPTLKMVVPFCDRSEDDLLRLAACLEEHFPHSMAKAVVRAAKKRGLDHEEMHSKVEYIVAHGISSYVGENKVIIGSYYFVFDDEKCIIPQGYEERFAELPREYSHIFMAVNGVLSAVICIEDPLRPESADVVCALRAVGFKKIVMMTGDSKRTAQAVADAGIAISLQSMQDLLKEN